MLIGWGLDPADAWHWGFGAAAVGMFFGLAQYVITGGYLGSAGLHPTVPKNPEIAARNKLVLSLGLVGLGAIAAALAAVAYSAPDLMTKENINKAFVVVLCTVVLAVFGKLFLTGDWTKPERARLTVIFVFFWAAAVFWGVFEQAGSTLTLFADRNTDNRIFGWKFESSWWQSVNSALIVLLAPVFSWLWIWLGKRNPSYPTKFGIGLVFVGLGFLWLVGGANESASESAEDTKVGIQWLFGVYLLHTIGELCLSPVGLSSMTKLAPARVVGMMMGVWFLAAAVGNFLGGSVSGLYEDFPLPQLFLWVGRGAALVMAEAPDVRPRVAGQAHDGDRRFDCHR